jgi:uncharacterized protein (TIGR00369 family)
MATDDGPHVTGGSSFEPAVRRTLPPGPISPPSGGSARGVTAGRYGRAPMTRIKDMDRWLGDGGMPIIASVGANFSDYGVDGEDLGWVEGTFAPTTMAGNPHGIVQAGVHALLLDGAMNFAINTAMPGRSRTRATLELKTEVMRPAMVGEQYRLRGDVVRLARQVAYAEATVKDAEGRMVSRSTGTFLLHRPDEEDSSPGS